MPWGRRHGYQVLGNFKNTVTYRREHSFLFFLVVFAQNTCVCLCSVNPWTCEKTGGNLTLLKHQKFLWLFCFVLLLFPRKTLQWPEELGGEYRAGEVSNRRAEKVVPFLKKIIKILYSALIYHFATCFPFEAPEECQEAGIRRKV